MSKQKQKKPEQRSRAAELRVSTGDDGSRTLSGLIPYNSKSVDLGGFTEIIAPGAFAEALKPEADVLALRDHDSKLLMGRTKSGTLALTDTAEGLRYTIKLPKSPAAADLAESVDRGDLDSTSFGFIALEDDWAVIEDTLIRTLKRVELLEVSPCSFAAYPDSAVAVRSCPAELRSRIEKRDDTEEEASACTCDCPACQDGDCSACSDPDCDCTGCTCSDTDDEADSIRHHIEMTLALRERGITG